MTVSNAHVDGEADKRSVGKAARQIIEDRFTAVRKVLTSAVDLTGDPEPVHQLRVATRRANAAITVFAPRLLDRPARRAKKLLRRLRRSAATARDADVFLAALESWSPGRPNVEKPGIQFLNGHVIAERRLGQTALVDAIEWAERRWRSRMSAVPDAVRRGGPSLAEFAEVISSSMIRALDNAVDAADFDDAARLHVLRVAGKRVRYALEVLQPQPENGKTPPVLAALADMQRILGRSNDNVHAIQRLDRLLDDLTVVRPKFLANVRAGITAFRAKHREEFAEERAAFAAWKSKRVPFRALQISH